MIETSKHFEEAFNLLAGELIGEGIHRKVFECLIDKSLVVKVETGHNHFANVSEWRTWDECRYWKNGAKWFAPCVSISPFGTVMLQKRVDPIRRNDELPNKLPAFLTDVKPENFGWLNGQLVCHDYSSTITTMSLTMKNVEWEW